MTTKTGITRFEYIGPHGREITLYGIFSVQIQDEGRTVKVFGSEEAKVNRFIKDKEMARD